MLEMLESTSYAQWILVSAVGWPLMLSIHAVGLAIIVGLVFSLNLRLLGLYRTVPYSALHGLMGFAWIGVALNVFTGLSIFMTQASSYVTNVPFIIKITFIVLGCVNLWYTRKVLKQEAAGWDAAGSAPQLGMVLGGTALLFWVMAVVTGRLIAYL